jgi:hypothetical protein
LTQPKKEVISVITKQPASQVSPFAAMTLGAQDARWLTLHSQLLPYMTAVTAKEPPTAKEKAAPGPTWRAPAPSSAFPGQIPLYDAAPQPTRHGQYDAVLKRLDQANKQTLAWQEITGSNG